MFDILSCRVSLATQILCRLSMWRCMSNSIDHKYNYSRNTGRRNYNCHLSFSNFNKRQYENTKVLNWDKSTQFKNTVFPLQNSFLLFMSCKRITSSQYLIQKWRATYLLEFLRSYFDIINTNSFSNCFE